MCEEILRIICEEILFDSSSKLSGISALPFTIIFAYLPETCKTC